MLRVHSATAAKSITLAENNFSDVINRKLIDMAVRNRNKRLDMFVTPMVPIGLANI